MSIPPRHIVHLRKVGGSTMLALPPAVLDLMRLQAGSKMSLAFENGKLVLGPAPSHYSLAELLAASDYSQPQLPEDREWVDAPAVGREPV